MKNLLILLLLTKLALLQQKVDAANYYCSSTDGDDSRTSAQAQNSSTPWKSISKLNSFFSSLQPGDVVLFKRGDVFYGSITINKSGSAGSPITFDAYGSGVPATLDPKRGKSRSTEIAARRRLGPSRGHGYSRDRQLRCAPQKVR